MCVPYLNTAAVEVVNNINPVSRELQVASVSADWNLCRIVLVFIRSHLKILCCGLYASIKEVEQN